MMPEQLEILHTRSNGEPFTSKFAAWVWKMPKQQTGRLLNQYADDGWLSVSKIKTDNYGSANLYTWRENEHD